MVGTVTWKPEKKKGLGMVRGYPSSADSISPTASLLLLLNGRPADQPDEGEVSLPTSAASVSCCAAQNPFSSTPLCNMEICT